MSYKYEEEINERIKTYHWKEMCEFFADDNGELTQEALDAIFQDFRRPLLSNARRALEAYYTYDVHGVRRIAYPSENRYNLPVMSMPCADALTIDWQYGGLYFIGMIGTNPDGHSYYLVKVGSADNVQKRLRQYATYNPMIYIGGICPSTRYTSEDTAHEYLAERAIALAQNSTEWFYVTEETYYELCDTFSNMEMFQAIAEGRD